MNTIQFNLSGGVVVRKQDVGRRLMLIDVAVDMKKMLETAVSENVTAIYYDSRVNTIAALTARFAGIGFDFASLVLANKRRRLEDIGRPDD